MRVLVTGSSGFLGRNIAAHLRNTGVEVVGLDIDGGGDPATVVCDLLDRDRVIEALRRVQPSAVVHLAARTDLDEKADIAGYAANIDGVEHLVDGIQAAGTVERCIFTSTQLVCRVGRVPDGDTQYCPDTLYGESKVLTEQIVRRRNGGDTVWCLTRPTTVWGPGMSAHYRNFFKHIAAGRFFHVGKRPLFKTFGFIGNVTFQYERLLSAPRDEIHGKVVYVGDYEPISLREWVEQISEAMATGKRLRTCPEPLALTLARAGDLINLAGWKRFPFNSFRLRNILTEYQFDMSATQAICGPLPFTMQEGVRQTVDWLRTNGDL